MDRRKAAKIAQAQYVHAEWPRWFYPPSGNAAEGQIFNNIDEVPDGWQTKTQPQVKGAKSLKPEARPVREQIEDEDEDDTKALDKKYTVAQLVEIIETHNAAAEEDEDLEEVEFLANWPKAKLIKAIIDGGIVPEDLHNNAE